MLGYTVLHMLSRRTYRGMAWIDLESPTPAEVRSLMQEFDLHPTVAEELMKPSLKSKAERFDNCIYVILHFPTALSHEETRSQEVDFVLGKDFIITTRYGSVDPLFKFARHFEATTLIDQGDAHSRVGYTFCLMLRNIYQSLDGELETLSMLLTRIEDNIFSGQERAMVNEISRVSRFLLTFKQTLAPHRAMLDSIEAPGVRLYGQGFAYHLRSVGSEYLRLSAELTSSREMLVEMRATNDSLLTTKQNETIKNLTVMAFITLPLSLMASLFGMNVEHTPIVGNQYDFWLVVVIMASLGVLLLWFFKVKKWL